MNGKSVVALVALGILSIAGFISAIAISHADRYYVSSPRTGSVSSVTCAYSHWTGLHVDEISFCSDDANKVIEWVAKANASLK